MCHHCVIDSVKERMLSRRDLFRGSAALATGAAAASVAAPALAGGHGAKTPLGEIVDATHTLSAEFPTFFGVPGFKAEQKFSFKENGFNLFEMTINEHTGTHVDAPLHFSADGNAVDEIAPEKLVAPLYVVDIAEKAAEDADAQVTPDDLKAWIEKNGPMEGACCVAMHSGWGTKASDAKAFRNADDEGKLHFPGFHIEATKMLMEETQAVAMAVDTLSLDHGPSADFATHYAWLPSNRYGIENMAALDKVPAKGATVIVGAPKHKGGSGGPARVFVAM